MEKLARSVLRDDRVRAAAQMPSGVAFDEIRRDLLPLLNDRDERVRAEAADSLGWFQGSDAARYLRRRLSKERSAFVKAFLLQSLATLGSKRELELFYKLTASRNFSLRTQALSGLAVVSLAEATSDLHRGLSTKKPHSRQAPAIRSFEASALALLNRIGDALVDVQRFAKKTPLDGSRETGTFSVDAILSEFEHVVRRVKNGKHGSDHIAGTLKN